jgi:2-polyprenyl-3-methyl-5-hydroxy-6-metoxy-1,4-benzoquinol methylase
LLSADLFLNSAIRKRFADHLVETKTVTREEALAQDLPDSSLVLEHRPVAFPSYPAEWSPAMLASAARLTLDLAEAALDSGAGLKDASPYNILFEGTRPIFVDALSFEPRDPLDPIWRPMAQFERLFLYPLAASVYCGVPLAQSFGIRREGPEPDELARWAGPVRRWLPPFLTLATLPARLNRLQQVENEEFYAPRKAQSPAQARFILERTFQSLRRRLESLASKAAARSAWSDYQAGACHYTPEDLKVKDDFVRRALESLTPGSRVLDIGANLGRYSRMAAQMGHKVVAIDADPVVMSRLFAGAAKAGEDILPLVVDLANPTPAAGWNNAETKSFLDRAQGRFDCVLMLAVVHHLEITHRIPLDEIVALAARLTKNTVVVEYVGPADPHYRRLLRGRAALHDPTATPETFTAAWSAAFTWLASAPISTRDRTLHHLHRRCQ